MKEYLNYKKWSIHFLYSALFQIMAGLCAIQKYAQIMHFDIKKENILYYKINPGGYFQYKILDQTFYVPNYGYLFIINDFGISRSMSPKYPMYKSEKDKMFRLGSRYASVKDKKFIPINATDEINSEEKVVPSNKIMWSDDTTSYGAEFRMYRKDNRIAGNTEVLGINQFLDSQKYPPFEFYNDTQDVIRMFVGGKRTTQKGFHRVHPNVSKKFIKQLTPYLGKGDSMTDRKFSTNPSEVLACYFILDFFLKFTKYTRKPKQEIIGIYEI